MGFQSKTSLTFNFLSMKAEPHKEFIVRFCFLRLFWGETAIYGITFSITKREIPLPQANGMLIPLVQANSAIIKAPYPGGGGHSAFQSPLPFMKR